MGKKTRRVIFIVVLVLAGVIAYNRLYPNVGVSSQNFGENTGADQRGNQALPVILAEVEQRTFIDEIKLQANIESRNYALVSPRVSGVLEKVFVREGDSVEANVTPLFQTDSLTLEKSVKIARQDLKIKKLARAEKEASLRQIEVDLRKAEKDYKRYQTLYKNKTVSADAFESKQLAHEKLKAARDLAQSSLNLAREEELRAETSLEVSEKNHRDALVLAPISGKVTSRLAEPGEMGAPGSPVVRVDDIASLEVSAYLPGQYYGRVDQGRTRVTIGAEDEWWGEHTVSYKSPTVDPTLRTFEIKCYLRGDGEKIVPGALVDLRVILAEREGLGVPAQAVMRRRDGPVIFIAAADKAKMLPVETGLENNGWTEVSQAGLSSRDKVVVRGQYMLDDGRPIAIQKGVE